ncbi:hypothetical protein GYMLUDRAFT_250129 [Collybiopsis luxurians FD-317 M1]|uniref:Uncharacterized protein n=1 Tax=Collybiopsis luxurians FD-317 M1 TaxID=944289 RepID=A0A0D0CFS3_9AGAR|nr:hypothetical protein GYMLUDRAFT_250129 [Collybiopsis luxurians FD-317 M1]
MSLPLERTESPLPLPSLRSTDFKLEPIFHPGRQVSKHQELGIPSPQKRPQTWLYPSARQEGKVPKHKCQGDLEGLPTTDSVYTGALEEESRDPRTTDEADDIEVQPEGMDIESADDFWRYAEAVQYECVGFVQLHLGLFAVERWAKEQGQGNLVQFEGDKSCPSCGDFPDSIIWDGVSIAFGRKHVNNELSPPTVICKDAQERLIKSVPWQEWLQDAILRKKLQNWLIDGGLDSDQKNYEAGLNAQLEHAKILQLELYPWLNSLCPHLRDMFGWRLGHGAIQNNKWGPQKEYLALFQILAAEESTMQMMAQSTLHQVKIFLHNPNQYMLQDLLAVPALYTILKLEHL